MVNDLRVFARFARRSDGHKPFATDSSVEQSTKPTGWSRFGEPPHALIQKKPGQNCEVNPRMTASSEASDTPAKPQDYASLRAELATLVTEFSPIINELWPRAEDHEYRWELDS